MSSELVALNSNWLSTSETFTTAGDHYPFGQTSNCVQTSSVWPDTIQCWPTQWVYAYSGPAKPIRLTLQEVERLRQAAKRDAKLKAVLAKFTDQIEVVVDLG